MPGLSSQRMAQLVEEAATPGISITVKAIIVTFFVGWNLHILFASLGPECLGWLGVQQTEICACFGDLVAMCLYCMLATLLRMQVSRSGEGAGQQGCWLLRSERRSTVPREAAPAASPPLCIRSGTSMTRARWLTPFSRLAP